VAFQLAHKVVNLNKESEHELVSSLVSRAQKGDQDAFAEIVRRHRAGMINVVFRMCGDPCLAEDATQTAFVHAWQRLDTYRPQSSLRNWLFRIAVNAALDMLRKEKPQMNIEIAPLAAPGDGLEMMVEEQERRIQVQQAVLALPAASRAVLVLREYEGLSYQEIAQVLEIPLGTVMSRLNYARTRLLETLEPYLLEEA
jgi:RNA polymerase sigma-70 factor (ECF subfamily)